MFLLVHVNFMPKVNAPEQSDKLLSFGIAVFEVRLKAIITIELRYGLTGDTLIEFLFTTFDLYIA